MSYTISLFTVGTKQKERQSAQPDFFEKDENLENFTPKQQSELENRLLKYQYKPVGNNSCLLYTSLRVICVNSG